MSVTPSGLSGLLRRTVTVSGHRTSVALEPVFWVEATGIARRRRTSLSALISEIDEARGGNLSSAIRVYVVETLRAERG